MWRTPSDSGKSDRNTQFAVLLLEVKQPLGTSVLLSSVACLHRPRHFVEAASKSRVKLEDVRCIETGNSVFYLKIIKDWCTLEASQLVEIFGFILIAYKTCINCIRNPHLVLLLLVYILEKTLHAIEIRVKMIFRTLKSIVQIEIIIGSGWDSFL